ncbi:MAG TPA: DUF6067 family protein [Candidatus Hydrogenedentes bacterium]|nr:DUF6067 family protein [Candidatus Hydrogenedentota bacterium]HQE82459.1 DUF6067 family protein [Candidatus Hydrogenedentota bacterium]HQM50552.1 DUF6067 family protein [Candidatus Hydrogenedentota bacterium]
MRKLLSNPILICWLVAFGGMAGAVEQKCILFEDSYGERLGSPDPNVAIWWASSGWKISQTRPVPSKKGQALEIRAARNEAEAAQLVVRPAQALEGFTAKASSLTGQNGAVIPAEAIEVLRVRYVNVEFPSDAWGTKGMWPDPLPPFTGPIRLAPGKNQPLWVRVDVPRDAVPGDYQGTIVLEATGFSAQVPFRVHVYAFDFPDRMTCTTAFGFDAGAVFHYQALKEPQDRETVLQKYLDYFARNHITLYDPVPGHEIKVEWVKLGENEGADLAPAVRKLLQEKAITPRFDWSDWDAAMEEAIRDRYITTFRIGIPGMGGGSFAGQSAPSLLDYKQGDLEFELAFTSYAQAVESHLREKGWLDMSYVYFFDEPTARQYEFVRDQFIRLKNAAPGIGRMITERIDPKLVGGPNIWCPMTSTYNHDDAKARKAAGETIWWYICTVPKRPFAGMFIDHPGTDLRIWAWQTWQYDVSGLLFWTTTLWTTGVAYPDHPQNPYEDPMGWKSNPYVEGTREPWGNGDGRFAYPPEAAGGVAQQPVLDGPVSCVRMEMLRDGIEDYEYMVMLERLLDTKGDALPPRLKRRYERLLAVPREISENLTTYTKDPAPIEKHREKVARAIEELSAK